MLTGCQSVSQFSHSVVSDSLRPHESQHARPPCPSPAPRVYSNSCPSSWWCHPAISSSVIPFSSCPQPLPASGSFPMSQLFTWGSKVLAFQLQHQSFQWTPRTDLLQDGLVGSPCSPRDSQQSSPTPQFKSINFLALSFLLVQLSHPYMTTGKTTALTRQTVSVDANSLKSNSKRKHLCTLSHNQSLTDICCYFHLTDVFNARVTWNSVSRLSPH